MEVTIERILPGGLGLAHAEDRTVMVALAAPGDHLHVRIDREKGAVSFASIEEIISPAPHRIEPPCQYFGRCGGCDFQQMDYQTQLDAKAEIIRDCLRRLARIEEVPEFQVTASPVPWHYRTRAQWQYDAVRQKLGYFESGSRNVCDVTDCAVLTPPLQQTLTELRAQMAGGSLPDTSDFRAVTGDDAVSISPSVQGLSPNASEAVHLADINRTIHGELYRSNANSFFQANDYLAPDLIKAAIGDVKGETALELYSGVGLFTLLLARRFSRVIAVESDNAAGEFARHNLTTADLHNAEVAIRDVGVWLDEVKRHELSKLSEKSATAIQSEIDFLLLDPPRTGAESRVIAGIIGLSPKRISYVSCDPATLARDLKKLIVGGYAVDTIAAFDMFPQTHHVETVVHLSRRPA